ncbi:hypothetical protein C8D77_101188 [Mesorhizobium loti]|uniref:Uncharacterized protein n=1 Tax=Rhizobium loti TaxID=381 RepID=A0A8E2WFI8_RHILI|nr:hypothetical protein [Mesorhizobium loti]PWJ93509.1 hypothetical protein C8D77_101188 [Mesorhizobium loti]
MGGGGNNTDFWGRVAIAIFLREAAPYAIIAGAGWLIWVLK